MRYLLLSLLLVTLPAHAVNELIWGEQTKQFSDYDFDANTKPWKEIESQLPAAPKVENQVEIKLGASSENRFFVDSASLSSGEDGVVRYSMVIESPAGARTISFEGMRCTTGERKLYAFGRSDGTWARNRYAKWEPIQGRSINDFRRELFFHYFCTVEGPGNLDHIRQHLKAGGFFRN